MTTSDHTRIGVDPTAASPDRARMADYLTRLEEALEVLGPTEAAETRAEVASHLEEAARDGRIDDVLATMGAPESFAAGILSERGMLATPGMLPSPGAARVVVAAVVDVVIALAPLALALPLTLLPVFPADTEATALLWAARIVTAGVLLVTIVAWPWYYWRSRNRPGRGQSVGRNVAGLRLVRAAGEVRVVRTADLPRGERRLARVGAVVRFVVAFWIVGGMAATLGWALIRGPQTPPEITLSVVAQDAGAAAGIVTQLTAAVTEGIALGRTATDPPPDLLTESAIDAYPLFLSEATDNSARAYEVTWITEAVYAEPESPHLSDATFRVEAIERGDQHRAVRFLVRKHTVFMDDGMSSVTDYRIVDIETGESWAP